MSVTFKDKQIFDGTTSGILRVNTGYITFRGSRALAKQFAAEVDKEYRKTGNEPKRTIRVAVLPKLTGAFKVLVPKNDYKAANAMEQAVANMSGKLNQEIKSRSVVFDNGARYAAVRHYTVRAL